MLDELLVFEHKLRDHVRAVSDDLAAFLAEQGMSEYNQRVDISYNADDGGRWHIEHYASKISTHSFGAELSKVAEAFRTSFKAQHSNKALRGLIAGPSHV
jgi:hypothetical protein